ncbi:MAG: hypothetical protein VX453_03710 [Acidobacteriota bacterium]|nr:hypothetical protein [Acidobacteriota bacterium]
MGIISRLASRAVQELARDPETRAKVAQGLKETSRKVAQDLKPRVERAWRDAQPEVESAKRGLKRFVRQLKEEYRKGRDGE